MIGYVAKSESGIHTVTGVHIQLAFFIPVHVYTYFRTNRKFPIIVGSVVGGIIFIGIIVIIIVFVWRQNVRSKHESTKIHARMMGIIKEENEV